MAIGNKEVTIPDYVASSVGVKYDNDKPMWDLLPEEAEAAIVDVLTYGAKKYDADNWRKVPDLTRRYYAALRRHLHAYRLGEKVDPESGHHHLAHAACCLMFMLQYEIENAEST